MTRQTFCLFVLLAFTLSGCRNEVAQDQAAPIAPQDAEGETDNSTQSDADSSEETSPETADQGEENQAAAAREFLVDVRSQEEWDSGHLRDAVWIPHTEITERISEVTEDKSAKVILYCRSGGRAGTAKEALEALGYTNVENGGGLVDLQDDYPLAE